MRHQERSRVLGVDPRLVVVVHLGVPVDDDEFRKAGLRVLDSSAARTIVVFADDPQMAGFMERLDKCSEGRPPGQKSEPYAAFVDAIDGVRTLGPDDRITSPLAQAIESADPGSVLRMDVELWHPDDHDLALEWVHALSTAVVNADGRMVDSYISDRAGVILARIYLPADRVRELAALDVIVALDLLPTPSLTIPEFYATTPDQLPVMLPPAADTPIVGVIDSGVASAHPLIGPAVLTAEALAAGIADGEDRAGHGTMVAGLILHGQVDRAIAQGFTLRPFCRLVSVAVLDEQNRFPDDDLWERDLVEAIQWCADQGASIINLSLGDDRRPFRPPRQHPVAALVDELALRLDLVIVVAAGNSRPSDYLPAITDQAAFEYPASLLQDADTGLIDPATAALALTVGGVSDAISATGYASHETVLRRPFGLPGWPSAVTRRGPGVGQAVKPELVERSGTLGLETGRIVDNDAELNVISTHLAPGRLLGHDLGTSMAAPLVTRVAAAVKARHPAFGANLVRALTLVSAEPHDFESQLDGAPAARKEAARHLLGYGRPAIDRAITSTGHRVVLVAEDAVPVNGVHIYELPVPASFMESGGRRQIDVALAFNPRTRLARLDYLANKMEFLLFRGLALDEVSAILSRVEGDEDADLETQADDADAPGQVTPGEPEQRASPPTLSGLKSKVVQFEPARAVRSRGANQLGRVEMVNRVKDEHLPMFLAVRNVNRWDSDSATQPYAIAITLSRSGEHPELYAELEATLEAVIEVPIEVQLEV